MEEETGPERPDIEKEEHESINESRMPGLTDKDSNYDGLDCKNNDQDTTTDSKFKPDGNGETNCGKGPDDETLDDGCGNKYSKGEILDIISSYKKDSRNFFWGDLQNYCNKMCRKTDDRWYAWSKEMMSNLDKNERKMRNIVNRHTHAKIQGICREVGGECWKIKTKDKLKGLLGTLRQIEKFVKSEKGMETCWGRMKYGGVFQHKMEVWGKSMRSEVPEENLSQVLEYIEHKKYIWNRYFIDQEEKDKVYKLYTKN